MAAAAAALLLLLRLLALGAAVTHWARPAARGATPTPVRDFPFAAPQPHGPLLAQFLQHQARLDHYRCVPEPASSGDVKSKSRTAHGTTKRARTHKKKQQKERERKRCFPLCYILSHLFFLSFFLSFFVLCFMRSEHGRRLDQLLYTSSSPATRVRHAPLSISFVFSVCIADDFSSQKKKKKKKKKQTHLMGPQPVLPDKRSKNHHTQNRRNVSGVKLAVPVALFLAHKGIKNEDVLDLSLPAAQLPESKPVCDQPYDHSALPRLLDAKAGWTGDAAEPATVLEPLAWSLAGGMPQKTSPEMGRRLAHALRKHRLPSLWAVHALAGLYWRIRGQPAEVGCHMVKHPHS